MKQFVKRHLLATTIAATVVGLSATAMAQGIGVMDGMSGDLHAQMMAHNSKQGANDAAPRTPEMVQKMEKRRAERMAQREKHMAERQAKLKDTLKITAEQEPAWNAFVARTAPQPRAMQAGQQREDWSKLTTPERLDKMQTRMNEHAAEMGTRIEATKSFYSALTPEQQKAFDTEGHRGFQRAGMKGQHRGERGHGGHHGDHGHGMGHDQDGGMGMMHKRS